MAAVAAVCVILGSAAAVSEREVTGFMGKVLPKAGEGHDGDAPPSLPLLNVSRSETVVAFGPGNDARAWSALASERTRGANDQPLLDVPGMALTAPSGSTPGLPVRARRCPDHHRAVRYYRQRHSHWLTRRGVRTLANTYRQPRSCPDARYLAGVWRQRAARARTVTEQWIARHLLRDYTVCAGCNAWQKAVSEVQRPYPGTSSWLLSCSASEGGWGRWVPNSQGSGVGGWLQFMPGTFARMYGAAAIDVARRGFIVPGSAQSWYSPLGQALAGAWGVTNGRSHEWVGSGC